MSSSIRNKIESEPFTEQKKLAKSNRSAFPKKYTYAGYLQIRTGSNPSWRRKYFVLNNNFLLCGDDPYAERLAACIPLEGSNVIINQTTESSDMKFELTTRRYRRQRRYFFHAPSPNMCASWTECITRASTLVIKDIYRLRYKLGARAKVIAAKHRVSNEEFAIKIIDKRKSDKQMLQREIQILKKLSNPHIVELCDLFETRKYLYIVMEYCRGGELFDKIANLDAYDDCTAVNYCQIMHQLAEGVEYMHGMGIVYHNLKPENILCAEDSIKRVKIADFGISAKCIRIADDIFSYSAPEILANKAYNHRVDYWSLGVIIYILICGYPPFDGENEDDISHAITNDSVEFKDEDWNHVSPSTQNLVQTLLDKNPNYRANCHDIIKHVCKVEVSQSGFKRAHLKLKQTVCKRKFGEKAIYHNNE